MATDPQKAMQEQVESWQGQDWPDIIRQHHAWYKSNEQQDFEDALLQYQGRYWKPADRNQARLHLVQFNMLFAIVESAISSLLPTNLRFTIDTVDEETQWVASEMEKDLERLTRRGKWRDECVYALTDAVLFGRYWLKTTLQTRDGVEAPVVRAVRAQNVYFDMTARRPSDLGYVVEVLPKTPEELQQQFKENKLVLPETYRGAPGLRILRALAQAYPAWMSEAANATAGTRWILTYEVYDLARKEMTVWAEGIPTPLCVVRGAQFWNPWVLGNLNNNGQDLRGLSEVQLVKDVIAAINRLLGYIHNLVRRQTPTTLYASDRISEEAVSQIALASPGDFVGVNAKGQDIRSSFASGPTPEIPKDSVVLIQKFEQIVSYVSALSDTARGQTVGAKTATELALIESQQRTRLQSRSSNFHKALAEAAAKAVLLQKKLPLDSLATLEESVHLVASNAAVQNRSVLQEQFQKIVAYVSSRPDSFDLRELDKLFVEVFDAPRGLLLPDEVLQMAAEQQMQTMQGTGPAPSEPDPIGAVPPPGVAQAPIEIAAGKQAFPPTESV